MSAHLMSEEQYVALCRQYMGRMGVSAGALHVKFTSGKEGWASAGCRRDGGYFSCGGLNAAQRSRSRLLVRRVLTLYSVPRLQMPFDEPAVRGHYHRQRDAAGA